MSFSKMQPRIIDGKPVTIGGSQVATILGISPFVGSTEFSLWQRITGRAEPFEASEAMTMGNEIEGFIAGLFCKRESRQMRSSPKLYGLQYDDVEVDEVIGDYPWASASPDGILLPDVLETEEGLEVKNSSEYVADHWEHGVPEYYQVQGRWYMFIAGLPVWHFAVLIGGNKYRTYKITRDFEIEAQIVSQVGQWYQLHVLGDTAPMKTQEEYRDYAKGQVINGVWVGMATPNDDSDALFDTLAVVTRQRKEIEENEDDLKNMIIAYADGFAGIEAQNGRANMKWQIGKAKPVTDWAAVAMILGANEKPEVVMSNTVEKSGPSFPRFNFKK